MMWQIWIFMKSGTAYFVGEENNENNATKAVEDFIKDGFVTVQLHVNSEIKHIYVPLASTDVHVIYIKETATPAPTQELEFDDIAGISIAIVP